MTNDLTANADTFRQTVSWDGIPYEVELKGVGVKCGAEGPSTMDGYNAFTARCRVAGSPTWRQRSSLIKRDHSVVRNDEAKDVAWTNKELFYVVANDFVDNAEAWEAPEKPQGEGVEAFPVWGEDVERPVEEEPEEEADTVFDREKGGFVKANDKT